MTEKLWINLGCGDDIRNGFVNVDKSCPKDSKWLTLNADLNNMWPFVTSTADYILAQDIIEHLSDKIFTMNEAWRVLKNMALFDIWVPTTDGPGAFQDPTHVSFWNRRSFLYYEKGNSYRERFCESYGIVAAFSFVKEETIQTQDGPKLHIILRAEK